MVSFKCSKPFVSSFYPAKCYIRICPYANFMKIETVSQSVFTYVISNDDNKFPQNSSLGIVSVFNGATRDLAVSNLTVTFLDLQDQCI